jgi:1-acyl-sn-glycerol-3-phosphate acyltransferase
MTADVITLSPKTNVLGSVDEWGRDARVVELLAPVIALRWDVTVRGVHHVPKRGGALLVTNARRFSLTPIYTALALGSATHRPVRFAGRPDVVPVGPLLQRLGGLFARDDEIRGALRAGELVVTAAAGTLNARRAGRVDQTLTGAAAAAAVPVLPVASTSTPFGRAARVEVGAPIRPHRKRRGPLGDIEVAELTERHIQRLLDGVGGLHTGVAAIDWLAEG